MDKANMNKNTRKFSVSEEEISVGNFQKSQKVAFLTHYNIGAAFLVRNKSEGGKEYIAKKILMGALDSKQQQGTLMEVNLLKNL
jgi:hypothetical protein